MRPLAFAAVLLTVAACGVEQTDADPTSPAPRTTEPTPTSSRTIITEGVIDKRVGEPGGFGCGESPDPACDVKFTVTAIEPDPQCAATSIPAGMRLLRIEVDTEVSSAFQYLPSATALQLSHWAVETADGEMVSDLQMVEVCSPDAGVFSEPLAADSHPRDSVVVNAPSRATFLWLEYFEMAWRWPVQAPV